MAFLSSAIRASKHTSYEDCERLSILVAAPPR
jgi:hypothetical protein